MRCSLLLPMFINLRTTLGLLLAAAVVLCTSSGHAGRLLRETAARLRQAEAQLEKLEKEDGALGAKAELQIARDWVKEGFELLRKGKTRKAAVLAERLPAQMVLVRSVMVAAKVEADAKAAEARLQEMEIRARLLRDRYDRLIIRRDGAAATLAYPRKNTGGKGAR